MEAFWKNRLVPSIPRLLYLLNTVWNGFLSRYLLTHPFAILRAMTHIRPVTFVSAELVQIMGGMRLGYAIMSAIGLVRHGSREQASLILSMVCGHI